MSVPEGGLVIDVNDLEEDEEALERDVESLRKLLRDETHSWEGILLLHYICMRHSINITSLPPPPPPFFSFVLGATSSDGGFSFTEVLERLQLCLRKNQDLQVCKNA